MAAAAQKGKCSSAEADPSALPTSTKWSVLSSRVEGLVAELSQVVGRQDAYCVSQSKAEGPAMCTVREKMLATNWAEEWAQKRTMFSYGEEMSTDPLEAMLLKQLTFMTSPRRVLEIGMFVGYGSVAVLEGCSSCEVVSLEIDPFLKGWLAGCLSPFPEVAKRHEVVIGPALESLLELQGDFDMVFVDANKAEYKRYVEIILERGLLSSTGVIVCDNILYNGYPYVNGHFDAQPARRGFGDAICEFNQWVCDHPDLEQVVLPMRDGVSLIRRRIIDVPAVHKAMIRKGRPPLELQAGAATATASAAVAAAAKGPAGGDAYVGRFDGTEAAHASPAMAAKTAAAGKGSQQVEEDPSALPTSTKWSVLSSRVEGLVAELSQVVGKQDAYCVSQSKAEGPAMCAVREKMLATNWAEEWAQKRTMFSYGEEMSTDPLEAMLLKQLTFMATPRRVLEIGMFVGYGSVAMLEGAPASQVVSLEIDPYLKGWLSSCLAEFPEVATRHEVVVGPALDSLPTLTGQFDLVFVDANKAEYHRYVELILEHKLLSPSGVIVCDNILYNGYPYVQSHFDAQPARRNFGNAICEFNQWVCDHLDLEQVVLPIRDGVSIIKQRGAAQAPALQQAGAAAFAPPARTGEALAPPPLSTPGFSVAGKAIVVTGSTSGLGKGIALALAEAGARAVLVHGTSEERGAEVVAAIKQLAPACCAVFHKADLLDAEACKAVVPAAVKAFGWVDGLVNSAALCFPRGTLEDTSLELWDTMFNLNTKATFLLTQAAAAHMKSAGVQGSIVNIASIAANGGAPWITAYSASKAAVLSMTKTNAVELRPHRIRVNTVNMGWCLTDKEDAGQRAWKGVDWLEKAEKEHPMGRLMRPIDVAGTVGHLLSDAATMLTGAIIDFAPEMITGAYE